MTSVVNERSEQEIFNELEVVCASPGYIHVLSLLSLRDNMISYQEQMTGKDMAESYVDGRTIRTEFSTLLGLMTKHPIDFELPEPQQIESLIDATQGLLAELHKCLGKPMWDAIAENIKSHKAGQPVDETAIFSRGDVMREPIFYGGESAYSFQYRDFAIQRYSNDNPWLRANKGFGIDEAHAVVQALADLTNLKVASTLRQMRYVNPPNWTVLPGFTFTADEVAEKSGLSNAITEAILAAFTTPEPPTNRDFTTLGDFNLTNACPILPSPEGGYISLQTYALLEALYDSPFYWMAADRTYKDIAFKNRGAFTENIVVDRLSSVFGSRHVYRNVNILRKGARVTEVDVLVLFADRAVVVQCKSKKLTLEARKGNDLQLRNDFKKSVQDAYDQAFLSAISLNDPDLVFIDDNGRTIIIPELHQIYPVCVVSDHYPALAIQAREFLNIKTHNMILSPFVTDVFFIDVVAEMLASPLLFLSYFERRVNYGHRLNSNNEIAILGYHLRQNLWIDAGTDFAMIDDSCAVELDAAMTVRREGLNGERMPKGILTRLDRTLFGRFIHAIEHTTNADLIDLGFLLLTLNGNTLDDLERGLEQIARETREDGLPHDFTLGFRDGRTGLTVHCGALPNAAAAERLARHCELRKYRCRADSWFGLVVRADDGLPKFGVSLRFPWKHDGALDEITKGIPLTSSLPLAGSMFKQGAFKRKKIGRNVPCPCGSGKKFKKCCML